MISICFLRGMPAGFPAKKRRGGRKMQYNKVYIDEKEYVIVVKQDLYNIYFFN